MAKLLNSFGRTRTFLNNAGYVVFRKNTAGAWSYTIPETRMYYIDAVGGGAGGWAVHLYRHETNVDPYIHLPFGGGSSGWSAFGPFYLTKGTVISGVVGNGGAAKTSDIASSNLGTFYGNPGGNTTVVIDGTTYTQPGGIAASVTHTVASEFGTWTNSLGSPGSVANGNNGIRSTFTGTGGASVLENAGYGGNASTPQGGGLDASAGYRGLIRVRVA